MSTTCFKSKPHTTVIRVLCEILTSANLNSIWIVTLINTHQSPIIVDENEPEIEETIVKVEEIVDYDLNFESVPESCKSKSRVFFLKTHKTASSVIENIMFR